VDFWNVDHQRFPSFNNITAYTVTLEPGDVLYLPPFWFHRVIAEELSISVSTWCDSEEIQLYYDAIQKVALPFEENWSKQQFAIGLKVFIEEITSRFNDSSLSGMRIARELVEQRYIPIFGRIQSTIHSCNSEDPIDEAFRNTLPSKFAVRVQELVSLFQQSQQFSGGNKSIRNIQS